MLRTYRVPSCTGRYESTSNKGSRQQAHRNFPRRSWARAQPPRPCTCRCARVQRGFFYRFARERRNSTRETEAASGKAESSSFLRLLLFDLLILQGELHQKVFHLFVVKLGGHGRFLDAE